MKIEKKKSLAISFKNAEIIVDGELMMIQEVDKDGYVIDENNLTEVLKSLAGEQGLQIKITKTDDVE